MKGLFANMALGHNPGGKPVTTNSYVDIDP
jgi:hypothetical protein